MINKAFEYAVQIIESSNGNFITGKNTIIKGNCRVPFNVLIGVSERLHIKYPHYNFTIEHCIYNTSIFDWLPPILDHSYELILCK